MGLVHGVQASRVSLESYSGGGGHIYWYGIYDKGLLLLGRHNKLMKQCTLGFAGGVYVSVHDLFLRCSTHYGIQNQYKAMHFRSHMWDVTLNWREFNTLKSYSWEG